jgi:hypothetical protein
MKHPSIFGKRSIAIFLGLTLCLPAFAADQKVETALQSLDAVAVQGPFQPNWASLAKYKVPNWYQDGKFGIFIHWGVYSVPAFGNEWYPRLMYQQGIRFTAKDNKLYAIAMAWPETGKVAIKSLANGSPLLKNPILKISLLGSPFKLTWHRTADGLVIELPAQKPCEYAIAFQITLGKQP